ncbi:hypothetical protein ACWC09_08145 [Streptomyces sp. NPDC001617]
MLHVHRGLGDLAGRDADRDPGRLRTVDELGCGLAESGLRLVYGGARTGLMGAFSPAPDRQVLREEADVA